MVVLALLAEAQDNQSGCLHCCEENCKGFEDYKSFDGERVSGTVQARNSAFNSLFDLTSRN